MSFILDALKKSEIERQRQTEPGLMDTPIHRRGNRLPLWALLLGALLLINTVVLIVVLMRNASPGAPAAPAVAPAAAPAAAPTPGPAKLAEDKKAAATADHFSPLDSAPVYAPEIPVTAAEGSYAGSGSAHPAAPLVVAPLAPPLHSAPRIAHRQDPLLTDDDTRADNEEVLPSINELNLSGPQTLPELHLDVHVYATNPAERFVYINMHKYHEGAVLQEGPTVEHIRRDGVVLNLQGLRFILPRQL
jgi:general secretion pathway protein B